MENYESKSKCCRGKRDYIEGIVCDVKNCQYHDSETHCTAKQIMVGPTSASSSADTACTTFKPKAE